MFVYVQPWGLISGVEQGKAPRGDTNSVKDREIIWKGTVAAMVTRVNRIVYNPCGGGKRKPEMPTPAFKEKTGYTL